jgi:competence protein ComEC
MGWTWWALGNRPAVFPVLASALGVVAGPKLGWPPGVWLIFTAASLATAMARNRRTGVILLGLLGAFGVGAALAELTLDVPMPPLSARVRIEARVEASTPYGLSVDVMRVDGAPTRFRAALSGETRGLLPGQVVLTEARFRPLQEVANPGERGRSEWAFRRGQPVGGSFDSPRLVVLTEASPWQRWLQRERETLADDTHQLTNHHEAAALLLTLAAGARSELGDDLEEAFARSGLAHVLSVSGLHVAVLAFSVFACLRWALTRRMVRLFRRFDARSLAAPLALPIIWGYVLFTGWQGPAVRSGYMCSLVLVGWFFRRRSDPLNAVAVAAAMMMVVDPAALFELSVQLSFVAVLGLIFLSPAIRAAVPLSAPSPATHSGWALRRQRWTEAALQTFCASVAVTLATGPLVLDAFQRVSLAGLISNVVTLPLSGFLTLVSVSGAALHVANPSLATPVLWLGVQLSSLFVAIAQTFAGMPFGTLSIPSAHASLMVAWWAGIAAFVFLRGKLRWLAWAAPCALAFHILPGRTDSDGLKVTFLAVGQGDAVVLSSRGHHALIDGGGVPQGHDTGQRFVIPFLKHERIEALDLAVLSHAHPDHALGLISTLEEVPTERLWLPAGVGDGPLVEDLLHAADGAHVTEKEAGDEGFTLGEAHLRVLGPPADASWVQGENNRSLVLLVSHGDVQVLLTGDIEAAAETVLDVGAVTVVKAPHHGSETSSTPEFIAKTQPKHVVFCVGRRNRFNFPRPEVLRRWEESGARCHRTDVDGAISFFSDGHQVRVESFHPKPERQARR